MVITRCTESGKDRIDWVKSIVVTGVFAGIILWSVQVSTNADKKSEKALTEIENIKNKIDRLESKIDRLVERR